MIKPIVSLLVVLSAALATHSQNVVKTNTAAIPFSPKDSIKFKKPILSIEDKVKGSRKADGLFTIYQDTTTGSVQLYVQKSQLGGEFIYQSFSISGPTSMHLN